MATRADSASKRLIGLSPTAFVRWATGLADIVADAPLDQEFQWISRRADALVPAHSDSLGQFLIPTELMLRYNADVPGRMAAYSALAYEKYRLPTFPVLIVLLPPAEGREIPDRFERSFLGKRSLTEYSVVRLWEMDVRPVFETPIPTLLPYVPLMNGGANESALRKAASALQSHEELSELEAELAMFAAFVMDMETIRKIVRWDMLVLRDNPFAEELKQIGRQEAKHDTVIRLLRRKFGDAATTTAVERIQAIDDLDRLDEIAEELLIAKTIDDLALT